jgi:CDP-glycerol glycerophosphotransferase
VIALSVVVPVYGVEQYLAECLDSLLLDAPDGVEIIAVNDASPDGSGEILAKYAARDARVRVTTLARNGGLGAARNTGFDKARGRYVWFVDADDWLPPGTIGAVLRRLAQAGPTGGDPIDVLIVDYARVYPDGRQEAFSATDTYPESLPDTFTLADWPALLRSLHIACNKVVRREFLIDTGIRFVAGLYEDVSFSIPLMLSAGRISVLNRISYGYRQRPAGSITSTVTERHFDVIPQWERVFAYLDEHPALADLRGAVFARMMWHLRGAKQARSGATGATTGVLRRDDQALSPLPPGRRLPGVGRPDRDLTSVHPLGRVPAVRVDPGGGVDPAAGGT